LQDAATQTWRRLSPQARELTRLLAVAGQPQRANQLETVAAATDVKGEVVHYLREAVDNSVLEVGADGAYWFLHPLLAEALEQRLLPEERAKLHEAFAAALEPADSVDEVTVETAVALADHHYAADHRRAAYRWALLAADAAGRAGGATEMLRLLRRALDLQPEISDAKVSRLDLLLRIRAIAEQTGETEEELAAVEDLLADVNRMREPLRAAELLACRMRLRRLTAREFAVLDDVREAVRLFASDPASWEHALAMAGLANAEMWQGLPSGPSHAQEAVRLARACGSAKALAYALAAKVMAGVYTDSRSGSRDAEEAQAAAAEARDFRAFMIATSWAGNCMDCPASRAFPERWRRGREELISMGAPHVYIAWLSADEASGLLQLGDWRGCEERLRDVLGSTPGPMADVNARLTAALLACRQGRQTEADAHLTRAEELLSNPAEFLTFEFAAVTAELAVASIDAGRAVTAAMAGLESEGVPPTFSERLLPLATRALADEAQQLRDRGERPAIAVARVDDLRRSYPTVIAEAGPGPVYQAQVRAMQAWYDAELLRARDNPAATAAWQHAARACAEAELPWDEAYACWRAAEALAKDRAARDEAAAALRRAHALAVDLQAAPLRAEIGALARSARISVAAVDESPPADTAAMPGLTAREREVPAHIVAGRTYGEIARELVLSEKTVSAHVSHLLRKTGAANRVELAQLARRLGARIS
jgi:DNA-binding CsgD family transcriptional regulator